MPDVYKFDTEQEMKKLSLEPGSASKQSPKPKTLTDAGRVRYVLRFLVQQKNDFAFLIFHSFLFFISTIDVIANDLMVKPEPLLADDRVRYVLG